MVLRSRVLNNRILNVFTDGDAPFSGNPLCVFEDAEGLSDKDMQDLARQLNLSENTFVTSGHAEVTANVRIFTPNYEMPFAGHQGSAIQGPSILDLAAGQDGTILVSGAVREVGRGTFRI